MVSFTVGYHIPVLIFKGAAFDFRKWLVILFITNLYQCNFS